MSAFTTVWRRQRSTAHGVLLIVASACTHMAPTPALSALPLPERVVAEGSIRTVFAGRLTKAFLPVTIHGQAATVLLDVGNAEGVWLDPAMMARVGIPATEDSLSLGTAGTHTDRWSFHVYPEDPESVMGRPSNILPGLPPVIGSIGTTVLSHYDLLFDGPRSRVRVYAPLPPAPGGAPRSHPAWLPPGVTPGDCTAMPSVQGAARHLIGFALHANGHPVRSYFDSGSDVTAMNLAAARVVGITKSTRHVHLLPDDSAGTFEGVGRQKVYDVTGMGLTLTVGPHRLTAHRIHIFTIMPSYDDDTIPEIDLGLDAFQDRELFVSYSTGHVCLGVPTPGS